MKAKEFYKQYLSIHEPYAHQKELYEYLWVNPTEPVALFAPTGSGKTEAAIAPFLRQFVGGSFPIAPRLIYVLPTQALCNKTGERIQGYANNVSPKIKVEVHHGAHPFDAFFMADIVVTTLDQFVYAYARASEGVGRHLDFPAGSIASSIVVFDEAHMYQSAFTFSIMRAMLEILRSAQVPIILMTATMPESLFCDFKNSVPFTPVPEKSTSAPKQRKLNLTLHHEPLVSNSSISPKTLEAIQSRHSVLIVVNQVKRAINLFQKIGEVRQDVTLIHSRFTTEDRKRLEDEAFNRLRKDGSGGVVVSTQVCEAGLDVSADVLITELAPADSLVQRFGRCVRFGGDGYIHLFIPPDLESPEAYKPYEKEHLQLTWDFLFENSNGDYADPTFLNKFVDNLPYRVDDITACDSLIDLFDATLYADEKPQNIQVREGKYLQVWVGTKKELEEILPKDYNRKLITLDYGVAMVGLQDKLQELITWDRQGKKFDTKKAKKDLFPFSTYRLDPQHYDASQGVKWTVEG